MKGKWFAAATFLSLTLLMLACAWPVKAEISLRFDPIGQSISVGENASISVMLDDQLDVRTIEIWVAFDAEVLASVSGHPGELFETSGCTLFPVFDDETTGEWYGAVVTMGPACYLTGPGELYRWDFTGAANGFSLITAAEVKLYNPATALIPDVTIGEAIVIVGEVAVPLPVSRSPVLNLAPNPFNPGTWINFSSGSPGYAEVSVFDLKGQLVDRLWSGQLGNDIISLKWEGTDGQGRTVPSGVYVFQLATQAGHRALQKGILLK